MKLIWTKGKSPLSYMIRWAFNIDCSHFAIVFESPGGGLGFESNLLGTHPTFYKTMMKTHSVVHEINLPLSIEKEDLIWDIVVDTLDGRSYDFGAFFYSAWRALLFKFFKIPIPPKNRWGKSGSDLCIEIYSEIMDELGLPVQGDLGMMNPHQLFLLISSKMEMTK